jgi:hypothetical protein
MHTVWPDYIAALEPEASESPIAAVIPAGVVVRAPDASLRSETARWSGIWTGWAGNARLSDLKLVVESLSHDGATLFYAVGSTRTGAVSERLSGRFCGDELQATFNSGMRLTLRMRG